MCCVAAVEMNNFENMNNFGSDEEGGGGGGRGGGLSQTTNGNLNSFCDSNSENEEEVRKKPSSRGGPPSLDSVEKDAVHNPLQTNNTTSSASTEATPLPPPTQQSSLASATHKSMTTSTSQSSSAPPSQPSQSQLSQSQPSQSLHQPPKEEEEKISSDSAGAVAHEQLNLLSSVPASAGPQPLDSTLPVSSTASLPTVPKTNQSGHQNLVPPHPPSSTHTATSDQFSAPARFRTRVIETADDDGVCSRDIVDALRSPDGLEILKSLLDSGAQVNLPTAVSVCTCVCVCMSFSHYGFSLTLERYW